MPTPPFDLQGGVALVLVRSLFVACLCSAAGTFAVRRLVAPACLMLLAPVPARRLAVRLHRLALAGIFAGIGAGASWLVVEAAALGEVTSWHDIASLLPTVLRQTWFGRVLAIQLLALIASAALLARNGQLRRTLASVLCSVALLLQALHGHAAAVQQSVGVMAGMVHLVAAALWLGALVPLILLVDTPPDVALRATRGFAAVGRVAVLALIGSAACQVWSLVGDLPGLVGTAYGWVVLGKLLLLTVLIGFAWLNRYRLAPALRQADPEAARRRLLRSVGIQTLFGVAATVAAGLLTSLPPAMHVQPIWPLPWRVSLNAVREDAHFHREVVAAAVASLVACASAAAAWRLRRRPGLGGPLALMASGLIWWALPHFDVLFAEAGPTAYFRSPTGFAAASIAQGLALYPSHCAACHGPRGRGDGPAAVAGSVPPADLTAAHLWAHSDGELFGWLAYGIPAPDGSGLVMPGTAGLLDDDQRWALIDAIRARNAGLMRAGNGAWLPPVPAAAFSITCPKGRLTLAELHGQVVRLVFGIPRLADPADVTTVVVQQQGRAAPGRCVTDDPAVPAAYALLSGIPAERMGGAQFLIDADGWLREVAVGEAVAAWDNPATLAGMVARLRVTPLAAPSSWSAHPMVM